MIGDEMKRNAALLSYCELTLTGVYVQYTPACEKLICDEPEAHGVCHKFINFRT